MAQSAPIIGGSTVPGVGADAWRAAQHTLGLSMAGGSVSFTRGSPLAAVAALAVIRQATAGGWLGSNGGLFGASNWLVRDGGPPPTTDQLIAELRKIQDPLLAINLTLAELQKVDPRAPDADVSTRKLVELLMSLIQQVLGEGLANGATLDPATERQFKHLDKRLQRATDQLGTVQTRRAPHRERPMSAVREGTPSRGSHVPWISQFSLPDGEVACYRAATEMARRGRATVLGPEARIQVGTSKDAAGAVTVDPKAAVQGREYIDKELDSGRPVVVGVSHSGGHHNVDDLTDHFVTVTGRGVDAKGVYYTFNDPGTNHAELGADSNPHNRLYVDQSTQELYRPGARGGQITSQQYEVTMVRRNQESGRS